MRKVAVVTVGRSDYGIYLPLLRRLANAPEIQLQIVVSGMHLSPEFGRTVDLIVRDGFEIAVRVEMLLSSDTPEAIAKSIGFGVSGFAQAFAQLRPDLIVVLGDRFEMHAAAMAAVPFGIPLAHLHGGELTYGAIDDSFRHSITKLSHLHFVSTDEHARRVIQMGEDPSRVTVSGALGLDHLADGKWLSAEELTDRFGVELEPAPLIVTYHPVTREFERSEWQINELLAALEVIRMPAILTLPNADTNGRIISQRLREFTAENAFATLVENFGSPGYFGMMRHAAAMVGNSSSGIIEAASLKLPVVNIGTRQEGRTRAKNVIDCGYDREEILAAIRLSISTTFRDSLRGMSNPYGDGHAAERIAAVLETIELTHDLVAKRFHEILPAPSPNSAGIRYGA